MNVWLRFAARNIIYRVSSCVRSSLCFGSEGVIPCVRVQAMHFLTAQREVCLRRVQQETGDQVRWLKSLDPPLTCMLEDYHTLAINNLHTVLPVHICI